MPRKRSCRSDLQVPPKFPLPHYVPMELYNCGKDHMLQKKFGTYQCTGVLHSIFESVGSGVSDESTEDATRQPQQKGRPIALDAFMEKERLCAADSLGNIAVLSTSTSTPSVVASYSPLVKQAQTISYTKGSCL